MNRSLIKRIWILTKKQLVLLVGLTTFVSIFILYGAKMKGGIAAGIGMLIFQFYFFHIIFEKEAKNREFVLLLSMPYKRTEIIKNLYFTIWVGGMIVWTIIEITQIVLVLLIDGKIALSSAYGMLGTGFCFAICGIIFSISMPLYLKMSYIRANFHSRNIMWIAIMILIFIDKMFRNNIELTYRAVDEIIIACIGCLFVIVSYPISIKLFESREF